MHHIKMVVLLSLIDAFILDELRFIRTNKLIDAADGVLKCVPFANKVRFLKLSAALSSGDYDDCLHDLCKYSPCFPCRGL